MHLIGPQPGVSGQRRQALSEVLVQLLNPIAVSEMSDGNGWSPNDGARAGFEAMI